MELAHVIKCNDSVEHVVLGTEEEARAKLEELREAYFERTQWMWRPIGKETPEQAYKARCHWHVRTVPLTRGQERKED